MKRIITVFLFLAILIPPAQGISASPITTRAILGYCTETDDGLDYYQSGHVEGVDKWGLSGKKNDICMGDGLLILSLGERRVIEISNGSALDIRFEGIDRLKRLVMLRINGEVSTLGQVLEVWSSGARISVNHIIQNNESQDVFGLSIEFERDSLLEYYCSDFGIRFTFFECQNGCHDGACVVTAPKPRIIPQKEIGEGILLFPFEHFLKV